MKENQEAQLIEVNISGWSEYTSDKDNFGCRREFLPNFIGRLLRYPINRQFDAFRFHILTLLVYWVLLHRCLIKHQLTLIKYININRICLLRG